MLVPVSGAGVHVAAVPVALIWSISSVRPAVLVGVLSSVGVPAAELLNCADYVLLRTLSDRPDIYLILSLH